MIKLNLTANDTQEPFVPAYLQENASDVLAEKINNGTPFEKDGHPLTNKKTLSGFIKYACDEAQKLAEKGARSTFVDAILTKKLIDIIGTDISRYSRRTDRPAPIKIITDNTEALVLPMRGDDTFEDEITKRTNDFANKIKQED